jgi:hypothetical protein
VDIRNSSLDCMWKDCCREGVLVGRSAELFRPGPGSRAAAPVRLIPKHQEMCEVNLNEVRTKVNRALLRGRTRRHRARLTLPFAV